MWFSDTYVNSTIESEGLRLSPNEFGVTTCPMSEPDSRDEERNETLNQSLKALSCPVRRQILLALEDHHPCDVGEFQSEEVGPAEMMPASLMIRLHHEHLPHLDEAGFIIWNRASNTIMKGPDFEELQPLMTCIQNQFDVDFEG